MAKTYKDMRFTAERAARRVDSGRQRKYEQRTRSSVALHFGLDQFRPTPLTKNERPARLASWRLEGV